MQTHARIAGLGEIIALGHVQRGNHGHASRIARQGIPLCRVLQRAMHCAQPVSQRAGSLQRRAQRRHLSRHRRDVLVVGWHGTPAAPADFAQYRLGPGDICCIKSRRVFQPVEHAVSGCVPGQRTEQAHQRGSGSGGRQLPAGFVTQRYAFFSQHGSNAAGQYPVLRNQRHRAAPGP